MSWVRGYTALLHAARTAKVAECTDDSRQLQQDGDDTAAHRSALKTSTMVQQWFVAINAFERACRSDGMLLESSASMLVQFGAPPAALSPSVVCNADAPPSSRIMGRWTMALLWLLGERVEGRCCSESDAINAADLSINVVSVATVVCPLHSAVLRQRCLARHHRHHQPTARCGADAAVGADVSVQHCRNLPSAAIAPACVWTPPDAMLALAAVALFHTDNFRVSLQQYDPQVANELVLQRLQVAATPISNGGGKHNPGLTADNTSGGCCPISVSLTLQPLMRLTEHVSKPSGSAAATTAAAMRVPAAISYVAPFVTRMLLWHLQVYAWRFSAGWISAGVVLRDSVMLLFSDVEAARSTDVVAVVNLFLTRVLDHIATTIASQCLPPSVVEPGTHVQTITNDTLHRALIYFLTYIWEPAVGLMMVPSSLEQSPATKQQQQEPHAQSMLRLTLLSSAVTMFGAHLTSAATAKPASRSNVVHQLSAVANTLNALQDYVAADTRCDRSTRQAVLETLAATR